MCSSDLLTHLPASAKVKLNAPEVVAVILETVVTVVATEMAAIGVEAADFRLETITLSHHFALMTCRAQGIAVKSMTAG